MSEKKLTLGQSIDQVISALEPLDEGARQTAINAACEHLGIISPNVRESTPQVQSFTFQKAVNSIKYKDVESSAS